MLDPGALRTGTFAATTPEPAAAQPQGKTTAKTTTKTAPKAKQPVGAAALQIDPVEEANTAHRIKMQTPKPVTTPNPGLGRIPFETGSFGLETDTQLKTSELPDGTRTRGWDKGVRNANAPSYFGLSLTVPTDSSKFAPLLSRPD